ncbi:MAG: sensor histidine kinase [Candidatus Cyclobacteriaceae bacterium M3_2C_046]
MNNPFKAVVDLNFYRYGSRIKWIVLVIATIISIGSIYYTNILVEQLKDREKRFVELYADSFESFINESNNQAVNSIAPELIILNKSIPVIWADRISRPIDYRNLDINENLSEKERTLLLQEEISEMRAEHEPIQILLTNEKGEIYDYQFLFYRNSFLLTQLQFYPYVQLSVIAIFGILAYLAFSYSRTAEENRVWVGLAKETAHQLGTPLSSLMAWMEYLKAEPLLQEQNIAEELEKDVQRLEMITARFSSIGSIPILNNENIHEAIRHSITYLQKRISSKVKIEVTAKPVDIRAKINRPLFEWVIENLTKNAVDAMTANGNILINIKKGNNDEVLIDFSDTGKGIPKARIKDIFRPGYTTKNRGWGLGLTLVKRIIENYHEGKIFVKSSEPGQGTTFRIILHI